MPLTTKEELQPVAATRRSRSNHSFPIERYVRCHQTSGTRGRPLVVLDTADDWQWWIDCWQYVLDAAQITPERPRAAGVFVWAVHRILECIRRAGRRAARW